MKQLSFTVPGEPVGKGRPRAFRAGAGIRMHTPAKTASYENKVALFAVSALQGLRMDADAPYRVTIRAFLGMPASLSAKKRDAMEGTACLKKPDADNIAKAVCDALNGVIWKDDSQVFDIRVVKRWAAVGRLEVFVEDLT